MSSFPVLSPQLSNTGPGWYLFGEAMFLAGQDAGDELFKNFLAGNALAGDNHNFSSPGPVLPDT